MISDDPNAPVLEVMAERVDLPVQVFALKFEYPVYLFDGPTFLETRIKLEIDKLIRDGWSLGTPNLELVPGRTPDLQEARFIVRAVSTKGFPNEILAKISPSVIDRGGMTVSFYVAKNTRWIDSLIDLVQIAREIRTPPTGWVKYDIINKGKI